MIETPETENPEIKTDKSFFLQWILACAIGYAIGMPSGSLAGEKIGYSLWDTIVSFTKIAPEVPPKKWRERKDKVHLIRRKRDVRVQGKAAIHA